MAESASQIMAEAKKLADAGQFGQAIEILQEGLKNFPKLVSARVLLGEVYMTSGDFESAKAELEQVIKTAPDNFAAYRKYQAVTILCAAAFLVVKCLIEYPEKFTHYEVWMNDGNRMTGHIEGKPYFLTDKKLAARKIESIKFHPDAHHYAKPAAAHDAAAGEAHAAAMEIKTADIKRLSAFVPGHSTYFAIYFTLTALHGLHVLGGGIVIAYLWGPGARLWKTDPQRYINRVEVSGLFWHFVDLVWIFLFPVFYLL